MRACLMLPGMAVGGVSGVCLQLLLSFAKNGCTTLLGGLLGLVRQDVITKKEKSDLKNVCQDVFKYVFLVLISFRTKIRLMNQGTYGMFCG